MRILLSTWLQSKLHCFVIIVTTLILQKGGLQPIQQHLYSEAHKGVVWHTTLSYGFRKADDPIEVEDEEEDEEMLPEAKDAEMSEEDDHEYLRTPKLTDDEAEEKKWVWLSQTFPKSPISSPIKIQQFSN